MDHAKIGLAAFCGGLVLLIFQPPLSLKDALMRLFGCVTCGFYGTPPLMRLWSIDDAFAGAVGALLGLVGLTFAGALLRGLDNLDLKAWLARWATKGTGE